MDYNLILQPYCGASGDMILAALLELCGGIEEFIRVFEGLGLPVHIHSRQIEKHHLACRQVTVESYATSPVRSFQQIQDFIAQTPFSPRVRETALKIFSAIFQAEAEVHGEAFAKVHLHELSADDSLIDIIGFAYLWEKLTFSPLYFSEIYTGKGQVQTRHGLLPVPAPAVLQLLRQVEFRTGDLETELLTPTGAAILISCGRPLPSSAGIRPSKIGVGAGQKEFPDRPNILRAILAEDHGNPAGDQVAVFEFFIDDMTPELMAHFGQKMLDEGALDFFIAPGTMKKGRPGFAVTVLCRPEIMELISAAIFQESSTFGFRLRLDNRLTLDREIRKIQVDGVDIRLKTGRRGGKKVKVKPEFADVVKLAEQTGLSLPEALKKIQGAAHETDESR